jgi:hypothetical protein
MLGFILFLAITTHASAQDYDLIHCAFFGAGPPTRTSAGCVPLGIPLQPNTTAFVLRVLRNETNRQPWRGVVVFESEARVPAPKAILSRAWALSDFLTPLDFEITESGLLGAVWTLDALRVLSLSLPPLPSFTALRIARTPRSSLATPQ